MVNNNLMIFEGHDVEVFELNGQVLFNPKHVAEILEIKNVNDNLRKMNDKQVIKLKNSDVGNTDIRKLNNAGENFLTESGVYKLVFKSRKPEAEKFSDWVTDEVLPTIRKHGAYMTEKTLERALESPDFLIQLATKLKNEQEARKVAENNVEDAEVNIVDIKKNDNSNVLESYRNTRTTYIYGKHPNNKSEKIYIWRIPNKENWRKFSEMVLPDDLIFCKTKFGCLPVIVQAIQTVDKCPVEFPVKKVLSKKIIRNGKG